MLSLDEISFKNCEINLGYLESEDMLKMVKDIMSKATSFQPTQRVLAKFIGALDENNKSPLCVAIQANQWDVVEFLVNFTNTYDLR